MDERTVKVLVQVGETVLPLVEVGISKVLRFARDNNGSQDTIAQLHANKETIDADAAQIEQELKDVAAGDGEVNNA